ncbi:hypothetical protein D9M71_592200 [compost metagenome]
MLKTGNAHERITKQLVEPGPALFRSGEGFSAFDSTEEIHEHMPVDLMDRLLADVGLNVFGKDA